MSDVVLTSDPENMLPQFEPPFKLMAPLVALVATTAHIDSCTCKNCQANLPIALDTLVWAFMQAILARRLGLPRTEVTMPMILNSADYAELEREAIADSARAVNTAQAYKSN